MAYYILLKLLLYKPVTEDLDRIFFMIEILNMDKTLNLNLLCLADNELKRIDSENPNKILEIDVSLSITSKWCSSIPIKIYGKQISKIQRNFLGTMCISKSPLIYQSHFKDSTRKCYITSLQKITFPIDNILN